MRGITRAITHPKQETAATRGLKNLSKKPRTKLQQAEIGKNGLDEWPNTMQEDVAVAPR
jgi:hypothetical protein